MSNWARPLAAATLAGLLEIAIFTDRDGFIGSAASVVWVPSVVAIGFTGGAFRGLVVAAALVVVSVAAGYLIAEPLPEPTEGCDPSCGISVRGGLLLLAPVTLALATLGAVFARAASGWRRRRRLHTRREPLK